MSNDGHLMAGSGGSTVGGVRRIVFGIAATTVAILIAAWFAMPIASAVDTIVTNNTILVVWDSHLFPSDEVSPIFWVDDSTILVAANKGPKPRTSAEMREREAWLYLWKLGEAPRPYGANPHQAANGYCAANGEVSFYQGMGRGRTRLAGSPGKETQVPAWDYSRPGRAANLAQLIQPADCELFADPSMKDLFYVTDPNHKFYIVYGSSIESFRLTDQLLLRRADGTSQVSLPIYRTHGAARSYLFDQALYVINSTIEDREDLTETPYINTFQKWKKANCWPYWRIELPTQDIKKSCVPYGDWTGGAQPSAPSTGNIDLVPTKRGTFFRFSRRKGLPGLYRIENGQVRRVLPGTFRDTVVSPSGCRVAFVYVPGDEAYRPWSGVSATIAAFDVCDARR